MGPRGRGTQGNCAKQTQFRRREKQRQVLGGKGVMVNNASDRPRQNKANSRLRREGRGSCTNKPDSCHDADREIGVPGTAECAKQTQLSDCGLGTGLEREAHCGPPGRRPVVQTNPISGAPAAESCKFQVSGFRLRVRLKLETCNLKRQFDKRDETRSTLLRPDGGI